MRGTSTLTPPQRKASAVAGLLQTMLVALLQGQPLRKSPSTPHTTADDLNGPATYNLKIHNIRY